MSTTNRVRKGSVYTFRPNAWDRLDPRDHHPPAGTPVRVIHPYGCPPPNTMGHAHVEYLDGTFIGLVHTASLIKPSSDTDGDSA